MENRTGIVITLVSVLISCVVSAGCRPPPAFITIDSRSALIQPTFCLYGDGYFQEPLDIGAIMVEKVQSSDDTKKGWELEAEKILIPSGYYPPKGVTPNIVWHLQYNDSLFYYYTNCLFGWRPNALVPCLIYGEVPPGYEEKVKAVPLEPEQLYVVWMEAHDSVKQPDGLLKFVIRLDSRGVPERLEYILQEDISHNTEYYLRLY